MQTFRRILKWLIGLSVIAGLLSDDKSFWNYPFLIAACLLLIYLIAPIFSKRVDYKLPEYDPNREISDPSPVCGLCGAPYDGPPCRGCAGEKR